MNKERLAETARYQYSELRQHSTILDYWQTKTSPSDSNRNRSALEKIGFENRREREIKYHRSMIACGKTAARSFYKENHAELYELAREEMEAEGTTFNEGDPHKVTAYHFGQEVAGLERESP